jgi:hypothetical protein
MNKFGISFLLAATLLLGTISGAAAKDTAAGAPAAAPVAPTSSAATKGEDTTPLVVAPSSLVDLTTAKFGRLDIQLKDASFLDAQVRDLRLSADNMDMTKGTLDSLSIQVDSGTFQEFTIDSLRLWTRGALTFDSSKLLNEKVLQFREPASAHARVSVSQDSLNKFLNAPFVLARLSGAAKKRVPILSTLAMHDVNFGFSFLKGDVKLQPDSIVRLTMDSKLGMGKVGMPVTLSAETKVLLENGWVKFSDTRLVTGGQAVPKDMAEKIVNRINSLSKWGTSSDDIQFQFTELNVVPDARLELEGSAMITRLRFARNQEDKIP